MHAEEPELRDLLYELARQDPLLEPLADVGHDARTHELPHGVANRALLVVEERVEREEVARVERRLLRRRRHRRAMVLSPGDWRDARTRGRASRCPSSARAPVPCHPARS